MTEHDGKPDQPGPVTDKPPTTPSQSLDNPADVASAGGTDTAPYVKPVVAKPVDPQSADAAQMALPETVPLHYVPTPEQRPRSPLGALLMLLLVGFTMWNVYDALQSPNLVSAEAEESAARFELYLLAQQIDAHAERRGELPESLLQVAELGDDVTYSPREDGSYTLAAEVSGRRVLYKPGSEDHIYQEMLASITEVGGVR